MQLHLDGGAVSVGFALDLTPELHRRLVDSVLPYLGEQPSTVARTLLGATAMLRAPVAGTAHENWARWVVSYSLRHSSPALFVRVVEEVDAGGALVELHAIVASLRGDPSMWDAPAEQGLWVPTGWPFIDRAPVRDILADMARGHAGAPTALAIEGPYGHGKKTIGDYIERLSQETRAFVPAIVHIRPEPRPGLLNKMVSDLAMALGIYPDLTTTHVEPERQAAVHVNTLALDALTAPTTAWFVANVIDHRSLEQGVLTFLDALLGALKTTPELTEKLRVVVVCDQISLLELDNAPPLEARSTLTQVTAAEIREWLEAAVPGKSPGLYDLTANSVVTDLEAKPPEEFDRLRVVSMKCREAQQKLASTNLV